MASIFDITSLFGGGGNQNVGQGGQGWRNYVQAGTGDMANTMPAQQPQGGGQQQGTPDWQQMLAMGQQMMQQPEQQFRQSPLPFAGANMGQGQGQPSSGQLYNQAFAQMGQQPQQQQPGQAQQPQQAPQQQANPQQMQDMQRELEQLREWQRHQQWNNRRNVGR